MLIRGDGKFIIPIKIIKSSELGIVENQKNIFLKNDIKDRLRALATEISNGNKPRINAIWLETSGCFGEIISLLNGEDPDILYLLEQIYNIRYFESIQGDEGEKAYEILLDTLNTEFVFIVSGAIPLNENGLCTIVAAYKDRKITALEAVKFIAPKAKHIITVGTCASYGGPTAASPNPTGAVGLEEALNRKDIIKIPGCPANPQWVVETLGYLAVAGNINLDSDGRPTAYYGELIHDRCPRRRFFDAGVFAEKYGDEECMFLPGCRGPVTYAYCPVSRWNNSDNWPIGDNTTCIGCAAAGFPDKMQPFANYGGRI